MSQILDKLTFNLQGDEYVLRSTETLATTYSDLKSKRDNSELIPGMWYRITDYHTTTTQENTSSVDHPFEILVQALTENTLSEDAKAYVKKYDELLPIYSLELYYNGEYMGTVVNTYEKGNGYFSYNWGPGGHIDLSIEDNYRTDDSGLYIIDRSFKFYFFPDQEYIYNTNRDYAANNHYFNNSNLSAWELKYCLDNDTDRFAWASPDGYGVIYYLKDEFNNSAPYDFKNIQITNAYLFTDNNDEDCSLTGRCANNELQACYQNGKYYIPLFYFYGDEEGSTLINRTILSNIREDIDDEWEYPFGPFTSSIPTIIGRKSNGIIIEYSPADMIAN